MFSLVAIPFVLAAIASVRADPNPNTPGTGAVYNEGAACPIAWDVDTTGKWTAMKIELMTGANLDMVTLMTVATVDGTDATNTSYSWTCPEVTPNAAEYFYQFTDASSSNTLWTTRFTIASLSGATVAAATPTQEGSAIPWGVGTLVGGGSTAAGGSSTAASASTTSAAASSAAPTTAVGSTSSSAEASASASTVAVSTPAAGTTAAAPPTTSGLKTVSSAALTIGSSATSKTGILSTPSTSASGGSTNAAIGSFTIDTRLYQAAAVLFVAATGSTLFL